MATRPLDAERYARYEQVLAAVMAGDEFSLADVHSACAEQPAAFVTSVVNRLAKEGVVEAVGPKSRPAFRWRQQREAFAASRWIDARIFGGQIAHSPPADRPRERLLAYGPAALRTAELLAILVRSGQAGESAVQAGEKIASRFSERLERLATAGRGELKAISPAIGETAYCQIMAGVELGRRVAEALEVRREPAALRSTHDAVAFCRERFARLAAEGAQEEFHIVTLDTKNHVLDTHQISVGLLDQTVVHPREVFRPAIQDAAKTIILVHNHPSGDATPSDKDLALTKRLEESGETLGIQVLDHIIVARHATLSLRESAAG